MATDLISPEYRLEAFCDAMHGKNPAEIMDAASGEIWGAKRLHRESTQRSEFRKGSKGREYCDGLQMLLYMFTNGTVPEEASPSFLTALKPLVDHLLQKWEIGSLRQIFSTVPKAKHASLIDSADPLVIVVSRAEVEAMNTSPALAALKQLTESPDIARAFIERVDIAFHGYDHVKEELFEIPAVRNFVSELDRQFPFWLFFLSKHHLGLQCLLFCILPPFLTEAAQSRIFPERINQLLSTRWMPAMCKMAAYTNLSEDQIKRLAERGVRYIMDGRFPVDAEPFA